MQYITIREGTLCATFSSLLFVIITLWGRGLAKKCISINCNISLNHPRQCHIPGAQLKLLVFFRRTILPLLLALEHEIWSFVKEKMKETRYFIVLILPIFPQPWPPFLSPGTHFSYSGDSHIFPQEKQRASHAWLIN